MQSARRTFGPSVRLVLLILAGLSVAGLLVVSGIGRPFEWVSYPFSRVGAWLQAIATPSNTAELVQERDALRQQLLAVSQRLSETQRQLETAQTIQQLESFFEQESLQAVMAFVIAYSPDPGIQSVVIQRGRRDGIEDGQAVITDTGVVIGTIVRTESTTATVRLATDSLSRILAKVQNESNSRGIVTGERGLSMVMNFIARNDRVESGQSVVTSGLDPKIPPDLLIGTIETTSSRAGELFQSAIIRTPVELQRLHAVAVVQSRL